MKNRIVLLGDIGSGKTVVNVALYHYLNSVEANHKGFSFLSTSDNIFNQHERTTDDGAPELRLFPARTAEEHVQELGETIKFQLKEGSLPEREVSIESPPGEIYEKLKSSADVDGLLKSGFAVWVANPFRNDRTLALHALSGLIAHLQLQPIYRQSFESGPPRNTLEVAVDVLFGLTLSGRLTQEEVSEVHSGAEETPKRSRLLEYLCQELGEENVFKVISLFDEGSAAARRRLPLVHTQEGASVSVDAPWSEVFKIGVLGKARDGTKLRDHTDAPLIHSVLEKTANFACNNPRVAPGLRRAALELNHHVPVLFTHQDLFRRCGIINEDQALKRALVEVAGPVPDDRQILTFMPFETIIDPLSAIDEKPVRPSGDFFSKNVEVFLRKVIELSNNYSVPDEERSAEIPDVEPPPRWPNIKIMAALLLGLLVIAAIIFGLMFDGSWSGFLELLPGGGEGTGAPVEGDAQGNG